MLVAIELMSNLLAPIFRSASSSITRVGRNQKKKGNVSNSNNLLSPASNRTLVLDI